MSLVLNNYQEMKNYNNIINEFKKKNMNKIIGISAVASNGVIGSTITNDLLWRIPEDMKRFKELTTRYKRTPIIIGSKTYFSFPPPFRPLPDRINIVVTKQGKTDELMDVVVADSIQMAIEVARYHVVDSDIFIAGGGTIYAQAMDLDLYDELEITHVLKDFEGDVFFPAIDPNIWEVAEQSEVKETKAGLQYYFARYIKK